MVPQILGARLFSFGRADEREERPGVVPGPADLPQKCLMQFLHFARLVMTIEALPDLQPEKFQGSGRGGGAGPMRADHDHWSAHLVISLHRTEASTAEVPGNVGTLLLTGAEVTAI